MWVSVSFAFSCPFSFSFFSSSVSNVFLFYLILLFKSHFLLCVWFSFRDRNGVNQDGKQIGRIWKE